MSRKKRNQFLTDEKGRKVAVQIDLRKHKAIDIKPSARKELGT